MIMGCVFTNWLSCFIRACANFLERCNHRDSGWECLIQFLKQVSAQLEGAEIPNRVDFIKRLNRLLG
jgi:hypothetical protein